MDWNISDAGGAGTNPEHDYVFYLLKISRGKTINLFQKCCSTTYFFGKNYQYARK